MSRAEDAIVNARTASRFARGRMLPTILGRMTAIDDVAADFAALAELAQSQAALVQQLTTGDGNTAMSPEQIVGLAARCVPYGRHIALAVPTPKGADPGTAATTGAVAAGFNALQSELKEGPAYDALDGYDVVVSDDLAAEARWRRLSPAAVQRLGIRSVIACSLYLTRRLRAALVISSDWPYAFNGSSIACGSILATRCSLAAVLDGRRADERVAALDRPTP